MAICFWIRFSDLINGELQPSSFTISNELSDILSFDTLSYRVLLLNMSRIVLFVTNGLLQLVHGQILDANLSFFIFSAHNRFLVFLDWLNKTFFDVSQQKVGLSLRIGAARIAFIDVNFVEVGEVLVEVYFELLGFVKSSNADVNYVLDLIFLFSFLLLDLQNILGLILDLVHEVLLQEVQDLSRFHYGKTFVKLESLIVLNSKPLSWKHFLHRHGVK